MSDFTLNNALSQTTWSKNYLMEYTRKSGFATHMGTADNSVIRVNRDLTKNAGDTVRVPYFKVLSGAGVSGSTQLWGSEEALDNYAIEVRVATQRNGVRLHESDMLKTDLQLANIARASLNNWHADQLRGDIISALGSVPSLVDADTPDTTATFAAAGTPAKNAYNTANADRLIFGTAGLAASGTMSTDLGGIASTEVLSAAMLDAARDAAESTSTFKITPYGTEGSEGQEYYILYTNTTGYNQLRADADIKAAMQYSWTRDEMQNPLFRGGDLLWNGVIVRKIPEIAGIGNVGTSSAPVAASFLCGSNSVAVAYSAMPEARSEKFDYGEAQGVAIRDVRGVKKMSVQGVQTGMVTVFHAA